MDTFNPWTGKPILVTGGCGFIGSHLVETLLAAGAQMGVLGRYSSRSDHGFLAANDHPCLEVYLGDLADPWFVWNLTDGVDTVLHLAALIGTPYSYRAPEHYVQTNFRGTLRFSKPLERPESGG